MTKFYDLWEQNADTKLKKQINNLSKEEKEIRFSNSLEFGTAGLRGKIGIGSNYLNDITITNATVGISEYILEKNQSARVLIAYDTRHMSKEFALLSARILKYFNIYCEVFSQPTPTPVLTYSVKKQKFDYGFIITASHNPKEYNGFKVVKSNGGQIDTLECKLIAEKMLINNPFEYLYKIDNKSKIVFAPKKYNQEFCEYLKASLISYVPNKDLKVIYTPLNGTGWKLSEKMLKKLKINYQIPKSQKKPNGDFTTCPAPNPSILKVYEESFKLTGKFNADIIVATDPDADRLGVVVKQNNKYELLSGNEVGIILENYILDKKKNEKSFVVSTVVSTPLAKQIAKAYNIKYYEVLTGFKNIADKIEEKNAENFIFGFEESCGYVVNPYMRDKDGLSAMLLVIEIANKLKEKNLTLIDYLTNIYNTYGYTYSTTINLNFDSKNGLKKLQKAVNELRKNGYQISGVKKVKDFLDTQLTKLPPSNFLELTFNDGIVIVRPSGTEPLLRLYIHAKAKSLEQAKINAEKLADEIKLSLKF